MVIVVDLQQYQLNLRFVVVDFAARGRAVSLYRETAVEMAFDDDHNKLYSLLLLLSTLTFSLVFVVVGCCC